MDGLDFIKKQLFGNETSNVATNEYPVIEIEDEKTGYKWNKFGEIFHEDLFDGLDFIKDQLFGDGVPDVTMIKYPDTEECEKMVQETYANYLKSERYIEAKKQFDEMNAQYHE